VVSSTWPGVPGSIGAEWSALPGLVVPGSIGAEASGLPGLVVPGSISGERSSLPGLVVPGPMSGERSALPGLVVPGSMGGSSLASPPVNPAVSSPHKNSKKIDYSIQQALRNTFVVKGWLKRIHKIRCQESFYT